MTIPLQCVTALVYLGRTPNISIVAEDIRDRTDLLDKADVIIFFNPFEQHFSRAEHQELLRLFRWFPLV